MIWLIFSIWMNAEYEISSISVEAEKQFSTLEECNSELLSMFKKITDKRGVTLTVNHKGSYVLDDDKKLLKFKHLCSRQSKIGFARPPASNIVEDILRRGKNSE